MTIEEKIRQTLSERGLFPHMCDDIMERIKSDDAHKSTPVRWADNVNNYPPQLFDIVWEIARYHTLEYIDEKLPNVWFRPAFEVSQ